MAIPAGITRQDVVEAIADFDAGVDHPYGDSTRYDLIFEGRRYPPKAIVGLAARRVLGRLLDPEREFSGGEGPGQANGVLRSLGFTVISKVDLSGEDWTDDEVALLLDTYFEMLGHELSGEHYVKAEHRRRLEPRLHGRTSRSIEFKLMNVSAVVEQLGLPHIEGYQPAAHYQRKLTYAVTDWLAAHPEFVHQVVDIRHFGFQRGVTVASRSQLGLPA